MTVPSYVHLDLQTDFITWPWSLFLSVWTCLVMTRLCLTVVVLAGPDPNLWAAFPAWPRPASLLAWPPGHSAESVSCWLCSGAAGLGSGRDALPYQLLPRLAPAPMEQPALTAPNVFLFYLQIKSSMSTLKFHNPNNNSHVKTKWNTPFFSSTVQNHMIISLILGPNINC